MANINQVIVNGKTILDLRSDTVTPETLQKGYTAHDKSGAKITGTLEASSSGGSKTVNFSGADADAVANITYISNGTTKRITIGGMESNSAEILADVILIGGDGDGGFLVWFLIKSLCHGLLPFLS